MSYVISVTQRWPCSRQITDEKTMAILIPVREILKEKKNQKCILERENSIFVLTGILY